MGATPARIGAAARARRGSLLVAALPGGAPPPSQPAPGLQTWWGSPRRQTGKWCPLRSRPPAAAGTEGAAQGAGVRRTLAGQGARHMHVQRAAAAAAAPAPAARRRLRRARSNLLLCRRVHAPSCKRGPPRCQTRMPRPCRARAACISAPLSATDGGSGSGGGGRAQPWIFSPLPRGLFPPIWSPQAHMPVITTRFLGSVSRLAAARTATVRGRAACGHNARGVGGREALEGCDRLSGGAPSPGSCRRRAEGGCLAPSGGPRAPQPTLHRWMSSRRTRACRAPAGARPQDLDESACIFAEDRCWDTPPIDCSDSWRGPRRQLRASSRPFGVLACCARIGSSPSVSVGCLTPLLCHWHIGRDRPINLQHSRHAGGSHAPCTPGGAARPGLRARQRFGERQRRGHRGQGELRGPCRRCGAPTPTRSRAQGRLQPGPRASWAVQHAAMPPRRRRALHPPICKAGGRVAAPRRRPCRCPTTARPPPKRCPNPRCRSASPPRCSVAAPCRALRPPARTPATSSRTWQRGRRPPAAPCCRCALPCGHAGGLQRPAGRCPRRAARLRSPCWPSPPPHGPPAAPAPPRPRCRWSTAGLRTSAGRAAAGTCQCSSERTAAPCCACATPLAPLHAWPLEPRRHTPLPPVSLPRSLAHRAPAHPLAAPPQEVRRRDRLGRRD